MMKELFSDYSQEQAHMDGYGSIAQSMHRWYLSLPKYVKEIKKAYKGKGHFENVPMAYTKFITLMNQTGIGAQQILFEKFQRFLAMKSLLSMYLMMLNPRSFSLIPLRFPYLMYLFRNRKIY